MTGNIWKDEVGWRKIILVIVVWCSFKKDGTYEFGCDMSANYKGVLLSDIPNGTMYYKVRAFNIRDGKRVYSSFSNIISITMY